MLLIQSDMMKASWLLLCPLAYFIHGPIDSSGTFCQVSGFFLAATIEAADIAVLMIALHTALTLLRPERSGGGTGLYPYRHVAYICWAVIPLTLAAIVPLTGGRFVEDGPNCYLPITPTWYRLMLSWIPRYIIFLMILFTYVGIYVYVKFQLARFCRDQRRASGQSIPPYITFPCFRYHYNRREKRNSDISTPPITYRGLFASARAATGPAEEEPRDRQLSTSSTITMLKLGQQQQPAVPKPARFSRREPISWKPVNFSREGAPRTPPQPPPQSPHEMDVEMGNPLPQPAATASGTTAEEQPCYASLTLPHTASPTRTQRPTRRGRLNLWRWLLTLCGRRGGTSSDVPDEVPGSSHNNICDIIWRRRTETTTTTVVGAAGEEEAEARDSIHLPTDETEEAMRYSRDRMQRQLRLLFVYPAIYVLTWIAPCILHAMAFDDNFRDVAQQKRTAEAGGNGSGGNATGAGQQQAPYGLQVATITSLCVGAAVDCSFFSAWEKPWRHVQRSFFSGLRFRFSVRFRLPRMVHRRRRGGHDNNDINDDDNDGGSQQQQQHSHQHQYQYQHQQRNYPSYYYYYPHYQHRRGAGRSREERARDARLAHLRRDQEALERMTEAARMPPRRGPAREWWDRLDVDDDDDDDDNARSGDLDSGHDRQQHHHKP